MNKQQIIDRIFAARSYLCVGLDTDPKLLPPSLQGRKDGVLEFNKAIIDATAPFTAAYKPNTAFYESMGPRGWEILAETAAYIKEKHPDIFLIADAKRGDIGNTSSMYARAFFEAMPFDAVTVAPYMGADSVTPFLGYDGKWVILLALTSNAGSADFQQYTENGQPLFEKVLRTAQQWGSPEQLMFVAGATQAAMFGQIREAAPSNFLLVPGVGAQGGSLSEVSAQGMTSECGLLVNSSRAIIYASKGDDFAQAAALAAKAVQVEMDALLPR